MLCLLPAFSDAVLVPPPPHETASSRAVFVVSSSVLLLLLFEKISCQVLVVHCCCFVSVEQCFCCQVYVRILFLRPVHDVYQSPWQPFHQLLPHGLDGIASRSTAIRFGG